MLSTCATTATYSGISATTATVTAYVLEVSSTLRAEASWRAVAEPPALISDRFELDAPTIPATQLYRLRTRSDEALGP